MIEILNDLYTFIMSGVAISLLIAALFVWYCIYRDMKDRQTFDEKYRKNRDVENKWDK
jgi:heme/copper-type cytochrome/quinol oxidase subunit 2